MEKIVILSLLLFGTIIPNIKTDSYVLTIKTSGLKNSKGNVIFALYNKDGSIPDQQFKKFYRKEIISIIDKQAEVSFKNLPKDTFAVTILHDENENGKIDKKFMLPLPDEGVGFSNHKDFGLSNRPNFINASFNIEKDTTIVVKVIYK